MEKYDLLYRQLIHEGTCEPKDFFSPTPIDYESVTAIHNKVYVERLKGLKLNKAEIRKIGFPISQQLIDREFIIAGGTLTGSLKALKDGIAFNIAGGTHHAFREHGEGYCVFNDIAVAIRSLQVKRPGIKVMVVDTDAHQGNGTNSLLDNDPNVFTYSIHVGRNDPRRKVKGSMDVETVRYVEGDMYLKQLFSTLAAAMDVFSPDLVIWIAGADNHRNDQFGQMMLTVRDIQRRDEVILGAMLRNRIPIALLYGGGYNRQPEYTAKLHRNTVVTAKRILGEVQGLVS